MGRNRIMKLVLRECTKDDINELRELSYKTYNDTFKDANTPSNMKSYLEKAFDINKLHNELLNTNSQFYFLYVNDELAGYLKLNESDAQTEAYGPQSIEVERIYVKKEFHSKGLGRVLLNKAIALANEQRKSFIWLGVWEKNDKAINFYKRNGFYPISQHSFFMGEEEQTDIIMRKDL
jgi:ribosomal protein S18 acetylase RimI-like enzyme